MITPGSHGSTFGGNPLAAAVGSAVVGLLETGVYQARARDLGVRLEQRVHELIGRGVTAVRSRAYTESLHRQTPWSHTGTGSAKACTASPNRRRASANGLSIGIVTTDN